MRVKSRFFNKFALAKNQRTGVADVRFLLRANVFAPDYAQNPNWNMKKIIYITLLAITAIVFTSCDDVETYAEQRDYERSCISRFLKDKKIKVISEEEFLANDTTTDVSKNEFVLFESTGVYMQIEHRGCGEVLPKGKSATVLIRFTEYNVNGDSLQMSNNNLTYNWLFDKFDVVNRYGTFSASFSKTADGTAYQSLLARNSGSSSVPGGWLVPLMYIKLGRPAVPGEDYARVKILVPHDQGHSYASSGVYATYYEMTYQKGI